MAIAIKQHLPLAVTQLLSGTSWKGGPLTQLEDTVSTPKADDLVLNHAWIKPFLLKFNDRVPSGFFVTDTFLFLDRLWSGKLLIPQEEGDCKKTLACQEAKKLKNLIGALRALWRSSGLVSITGFGILILWYLHYMYLCRFCLHLWWYVKNTRCSCISFLSFLTTSIPPIQPSIYITTHHLGKQGSHPRISELKALLIPSPTRSRKACILEGVGNTWSHEKHASTFSDWTYYESSVKPYFDPSPIMATFRSLLKNFSGDGLYVKFHQTQKELAKLNHIFFSFFRTAGWWCICESCSGARAGQWQWVWYNIAVG